MDTVKSHNQNRERPSARKQVVAGFVVYRRTSEGIKYLLLYRRGNYWNFPKGHFEPGERDMDVAIRELEEETGIKRSEIHIVPNFRTYERYQFRLGHEMIRDTVILFLCETRKAEVKLIPREHSGYAWYTYEEALLFIGKKYEDTRRILRQARSFLQPKRKPHP